MPFYSEIPKKPLHWAGTNHGLLGVGMGACLYCDKKDLTKEEQLEKHLSLTRLLIIFHRCAVSELSLFTLLLYACCWQKDTTSKAWSTIYIEWTLRSNDTFGVWVNNFGIWYRTSKFTVDHLRWIFYCLALAGPMDKNIYLHILWTNIFSTKKSCV